MDFSTLVSVVREPNMCSGGYETIREIIKESNLRHDAKILEIGSNTGFSSFEFATILPHAQVTGIDINPQSVEFAQEKAKKYKLSNVNFLCSDARALPFDNQTFDLVFCSNVTSFIEEKEKAIIEYIRVLKKGGILAAVPIYYRKQPPQKLVQKVGEAIGTKIEVWDRSFWEGLFQRYGDLQLYFAKDYEYVPSTEEEIETYVEMVMDQKHLASVDPKIKQALKNRLTYLYQLFDFNLTYAGFSILLYRKCPVNRWHILHKSIPITRRER